MIPTIDKILPFIDFIADFVINSAIFKLFEICWFFIFDHNYGIGDASKCDHGLRYFNFSRSIISPQRSFYIIKSMGNIWLCVKFIIMVAEHFDFLQKINIHISTWPLLLLFSKTELFNMFSIVWDNVVMKGDFVEICNINYIVNKIGCSHMELSPLRGNFISKIPVSFVINNKIKILKKCPLCKSH